MDTLLELVPSLDEIVTNTSLDKLFDHPGFRLIFIDDDGNMSLLGPFDEESRKNVKEYRCISHVWGTGTKKEHVWKDHPIKGATWEVEVRKEKHERLLQVFNHHKGYFWMDVFCTNQQDVNKPLDIMRDIYSHCVECICLLDFRSRRIFHGYITEKSFLEDMSTRASDLCAARGVRVIKLMFETCLTRFSFLEVSIAYCSWSKRVWTWQESLLPPKVYICDETCNTKEYGPMDRDTIIKVRNNMSELLCDFSAITPFGDDYSLPRMMMSHRKCTELEDYIYGILGLLDVSIEPGLKARDAAKRLQEQLDRENMNVKIRIDVEWKCLGDVFVGDMERDKMIKKYAKRVGVDLLRSIPNKTKRILNIE